MEAKMNFEEIVLRKFSDAVVDKVTRRTIRGLQTMTGCVLYGEDYGLKNAWDMICVQVQGMESFMWQEYVNTAESVAWGAIGKLKRHEKQALWMRDEESWDVIYDESGVDENLCGADEDIARWFVCNFLLSVAAEWSNKQIKAYLHDSWG